MTNQGSYQIRDYYPGLEQEWQRLQIQCEIAWEKEKRTLQWFGLQDEMSVLELGSGPGFVTQKLLSLLPNSQVTALDMSPVMIEQSQKYLQNFGERVNFVEASVTDTGLPDNSFDFAFARLIFQHLPDPVAACKEIIRVLKPGGKLVIADIDQNTSRLFYPPVVEFQLILNKLALAQEKDGGNRHIGRQLWSILKQGGFENLDLETIIFHSGINGIDNFLTQLEAFVLLLEKENLLTEEDLKNIQSAREKFISVPDSFIGVIRLMACGTKPLVRPRHCP
jgi:ubiquinone/menaquinone biosynthesis C-methylase UbiE